MTLYDLLEATSPCHVIRNCNIPLLADQHVYLVRFVRDVMELTRRNNVDGAFSRLAGARALVSKLPCSLLAMYLVLLQSPPPLI
jgi:hypothetical protein